MAETFVQLLHKRCGGHIILAYSGESEEVLIGCDSCGKAWAFAEGLDKDEDWIEIPQGTEIVSDGD